MAFTLQRRAKCVSLTSLRKSNVPPHQREGSSPVHLPPSAPAARASSLFLRPPGPLLSPGICTYYFLSPERSPSGREGSVAAPALNLLLFRAFPGSSIGKEPACNAGYLGSIPGLERSPGEGKGCPLQYSCPENPWTIQSMGSQSQTHLSDFHSLHKLKVISHQYLSVKASRSFFKKNFFFHTIWLMGS